MARPRTIKRWESRTYQKAYCYDRDGVAWMYAFHKGKILRKSTYFRWDECNREAALQLLDQHVMGMIHPELLPKKSAQLILLKDAQTEFWDAKENLTDNEKGHYKRSFSKYFDGLDLSTYILEDESLYHHLIDRNKVASREIQDSTREKYLQYLRLFLDFCVKRRYILEHPIGDEIDIPTRAEKEDVLIYEPEEMAAFIEYFQEKAKDERHLRHDQRNSALFALNIRLLWLTAMRPGESIKMQWSHFEADAFKIIGKRTRNNKPKNRPFPLTLSQTYYTILPKEGRVNRIERWMAAIRDTIEELRKWKGCYGEQVFPWTHPAAITRAIRQAKLDLKFPDDDERTVRTIRATAINFWEDDLGIDWVTACDLAGHNPSVRFKYYRKKRTAKRIIAAITRDAVRVSGLDAVQPNELQPLQLQSDPLQWLYKTPTVN